MRKIIEYALISIDGVFDGQFTTGFFQYRDDAYIRDELGQLLAFDAMLMGRTTYESFSKMWPGRQHPWADRLNVIKKYVFSSKLGAVEWNNSTLVRGDVIAGGAETEAATRRRSSHLRPRSPRPDASSGKAARRT